MKSFFVEYILLVQWFLSAALPAQQRVVSEFKGDKRIVFCSQRVNCCFCDFFSFLASAVIDPEVIDLKKDNRRRRKRCTRLNTVIC